MAVAWFLCIGGWLYAAVIPDIYEAEARFYLDTSSMFEPVFEDQIITSNPETQLNFIRESLFGRSELASVARETGLDAEISSDIAYENMLNVLRENISFNAINPSSDARSSDRIYDLRFRHESRDTAIAVVDSLLNTFIEGALGEAQEDDDQRLQAVEEFILEREAEVRNQERAISDFKRQNASSLPGAQGDYLRRLQEEKEDQAEAGRRLRSLNSRQALLLQQIDRLREVVPSSNVEPPPNSLAARERDLQQELDELRLKYTDAHPAVVALSAILNDVKRQRSEELDAMGLGGADLGALVLEANPVYQDTLIALNESELQIAELETEIEERETKLEELESLIDESLANEDLMAALEGGLAGARAELEELRSDRRTLILTRQTAATDQMDFRSINDPQSLLAPVGPARLLMILVVFLGALGAGGASCYGLAQVKPVFSSARSLNEAVEFPVLGSVTNAWPASEQAAYHRSFLAFSVALSLLLFALVCIVAFEQFGPGIHAPFSSG